MSELKPWPNADDFYPPKHLIPPGSSAVDADMLKYERARAEAAIARLREALEALRAIKEDPLEYLTNHDEVAAEALALIGDIPEST